MELSDYPKLSLQEKYPHTHRKYTNEKYKFTSKKKTKKFVLKKIFDDKTIEGIMSASSNTECKHPVITNIRTNIDSNIIHSVTFQIGNRDICTVFGENFGVLYNIFGLNFINDGITIPFSFTLSGIEKPIYNECKIFVALKESIDNLNDYWIKYDVQDAEDSLLFMSVYNVSDRPEGNCSHILSKNSNLTLNIDEDDEILELSPEPENFPCKWKAFKLSDMHDYNNLVNFDYIKKVKVLGDQDLYFVNVKSCMVVNNLIK